MSPALPFVVPSAVPRTASTSAASDLLLMGRVTLSLLVVLVLAVVVARIARRAGGGAGSGSVRVRARVGLTREASLAVVEIGDSALVLGVTPSSVALLTTVNATALGADPLLSEPPAGGVRPAGRSGLAPAVRQIVETWRDRTARR